MCVLSSPPLVTKLPFFGHLFDPLITTLCVSSSHPLLIWMKHFHLSSTHTHTHTHTHTSCTIDCQYSIFKLSELVIAWCTWQIVTFSCIHCAIKDINWYRMCVCVSVCLSGKLLPSLLVPWILPSLFVVVIVTVAITVVY